MSGLGKMPSPRGGQLDPPPLFFFLCRGVCWTFLGAGPFGFIPVMVSICFRVGLFAKVRVNLGFLSPVRAATISITTAGLDDETVLIITFLNMLDLVIGLSLLFTPQSNARDSSMFVMTVAVNSFGLFCLLSYDRYKFKTINPPLRKLEDNFFKYIGEWLGVFCCCCCDHTTKDEKQKLVSMV